MENTGNLIIDAKSGKYREFDLGDLNFGKAQQKKYGYFHVHAYSWKKAKGQFTKVIIT